MKADYYSLNTDEAPANLDASCLNKYGNAYFVVNGECKYTFKDSQFEGIM